MDLNALNRMDAASFTAALDGVAEHSPWVAQQAWNARPFADVAALHAAMVKTIVDAAPELQLALLRAHPELAGREAQAGTMTDSSKAEQSSVGLNNMTAAEMARIRELNQAYSTKFGHPFIIAVRNHSKQGIFAAFEKRLNNPPEVERKAALAEVCIIARLRLDARFATPTEKAG